MSEDIAGKGDPVKVLELMWGRETAQRRGPKPKVTVPDLVAAAIHLADTEGLDAVSTRRVADAVGISPMSFYTHIPGKAELLDLMLDSAIGESQPDRPTFEPAQWRENLTEVAQSLRRFYIEHPWVLQLSTHRPILGPNTMLSYEIALSAVDGLGLGEIDMDMVVTLISNYVFGAVRDAARERMVRDSTGMTDEQWWRRVEPFLDTVDFSAYPVTSRVGPVTGAEYGAHDPQRAFTFGLERLLDGLQLFIERKRAGF